jgi:hypothetical protein
MSKLSKRVISLILTGVLCLHVGFLFMYTSPLKITNPKVNFITKAVVGPFFHQNWNLFVPAPKAQHYLFVRYKNADNRVQLRDILGDCVENNQQHKWKGNETIALLFSNSLVYLLNKVPDSKLYQQAPDFTEFKVLQYELSHYLALHHKLKKGQAYELIVYSTEPGRHKTLYFQSLSLK